MDVTVMDPTERYRKLIAYLQSHRAGLGEPQMVSVGGAPPADQTGLRCHEFEVGLVTESTRLANCEHAFCRSCLERLRCECVLKPAGDCD